MHFEPIYPACRFFCSFCGKETQADKYLTVRAQDYNHISHEPKFLVFCELHREKYAELCERMDTWRNQERAKFEQALNEEAPKMAQVISAEVFGTKPSQTPKVEPPKRRKSAGEIPNPRELN